MDKNEIIRQARRLARSWVKEECAIAGLRLECMLGIVTVKRHLLLQLGAAGGTHSLFWGDSVNDMEGWGSSFEPHEMLLRQGIIGHSMDDIERKVISTQAKSRWWRVFMCVDAAIHNESTFRSAKIGNYYGAVIEQIPFSRSMVLGPTLILACERAISEWQIPTKPSCAEVGWDFDQSL